jgi:uncharacterized protein YjbI with pentapeptide repeats
MPTKSEYLELLNSGVKNWNHWRAQNPGIQPNLTGAKLRNRQFENINFRGVNLKNAVLCGSVLSKANLHGALFDGANLTDSYLNTSDLSSASLRECKCTRTIMWGSDLTEAILDGAEGEKQEFRGANLTRASLRDVAARHANFEDATLERTDLSGATLYKANFRNADCTEAIFREASVLKSDFTNSILYAADLSEGDFSQSVFRKANLNQANLQGSRFARADMREAELRFARMIETNLERCDLSGCWIYGLSAWAVNATNARQLDLLITREGEPRVTIDNLEVAQFVYLLLDNRRIRDIINTITTKVVLILGRFTPERKKILDGLRTALRRFNYLPVIFDFDAPATRTLTDTVSVLAHMARFVIADITDARSIPQELMRIVPNLPLVPIQPLLKSSGVEYGMFADFRLYQTVLEVFKYDDEKHLLASLQKSVIAPAEKRARALQGKLARAK